jgi:hypothetical protein
MQTRLHLEPPISLTGGVARRRRLPAAVVCAAGVVGGVALGWVARAFMRLFSEDPEFSWSGTLFIVGVFTVFAGVQAAVVTVRRATTKRVVTAPARLLGGISVLL